MSGGTSGAAERLLRFARGEIMAQVYPMEAVKLDAVRRDVRALYELMVTWRSTAQRWTPGGSEFMDPAFCARFIEERRMLHHQDRVELHRLKAALQNAPKPEVAAEGAPSTAGSGRPSPNPSEPRT